MLSKFHGSHRRISEVITLRAIKMTILSPPPSEAACENLFSADDVMEKANDDVMDYVYVTVRDDVMVA